MKHAIMYIVGIIGFFACCLIGIVAPLHEFVSFSLYYKPMYGIFGGNFYFPFYLYVLNDIIPVVVFTLFIILTIAGANKLPAAIPAIILFIVFVITCGIVYAVYREDFDDIGGGNYSTETASLKDLEKGRSRGGGKRSVAHVYYRLKNYDARDIRIFKLDVMSYRNMQNTRDDLRGEFVRQNGLDEKYTDMPYDEFCRFLESLPREDRLEAFDASWRDCLRKNKIRVYYLPHSGFVLKYERESK
jgi:hypothetical protein